MTQQMSTYLSQAIQLDERICLAEQWGPWEGYDQDLEKLRAALSEVEFGLMPEEHNILHGIGSCHPAENEYIGEQD